MKRGDPVSSETVDPHPPSPPRSEIRGHKVLRRGRRLRGVSMDGSMLSDASPSGLAIQGIGRRQGAFRGT